MKLKISDISFKLSHFCHQMIDRPKACLLATCGGLISFLPVLKVSAYVFDFAKDVALFMYFGLDRWGFIHFETIHGLIIYYGVSILASSLAMTYIVQMTKDGFLKATQVSHCKSPMPA